MESLPFVGSPTKSHVFTLAGTTFHLRPLAQASDGSPRVTLLAVHTLAHASFLVVADGCPGAPSMKLGGPHQGAQ